MRLIVGKDIIAKDLAFRKVVRQKQCLPGPRQNVILFESASCKNSETSCCESRRTFQFGGPVKFMIMNRYSCISTDCSKLMYEVVEEVTHLAHPHCAQPSYAHAKSQPNLESSNPHSQQNFCCFIIFYVLTYALPGIVDGAKKKSQGGSWRWVRASVSMLEASTSREQ